MAIERTDAACYACVLGRLGESHEQRDAALAFDRVRGQFIAVDAKIVRPTWFTRLRARLGSQCASVAIARYRILCTMGRDARRHLAAIVQVESGPQVLALATHPGSLPLAANTKVPLRERLTKVFREEDLRENEGNPRSDSFDLAEEHIRDYVEQDKPLSADEARWLALRADGWIGKFREVNESYLRNHVRFGQHAEFVELVKQQLPEFNQKFFRDHQVVDPISDELKTKPPRILEPCFHRYQAAAQAIAAPGLPEGVNRLEFMAACCDFANVHGTGKFGSDWSVDDRVERQLARFRGQAQAGPVPVHADLAQRLDELAADFEACPPDAPPAVHEASDRLRDGGPVRGLFLRLLAGRRPQDSDHLEACRALYRDLIGMMDDQDPRLLDMIARTLLRRLEHSDDAHVDMDKLREDALDALAQALPRLVAKQRNAKEKIRDRRNAQVESMREYLSSAAGRALAARRLLPGQRMSDEVMALLARHVLTRRIPAPLPPTVSLAAVKGQFNTLIPGFAEQMVSLYVRLAATGATNKMIARALRDLPPLPQDVEVADDEPELTGWRPADSRAAVEAALRQPGVTPLEISSAARPVPTGVEVRMQRRNEEEIQALLQKLR